MEIQILKDRILLQPLKEILHNGLELPEEYMEKPFKKALVISIGPKCTKSLKPGDTVLYQKLIAKPLVYAGRKYLMINELDGIIGVIEGNPNDVVIGDSASRTMQ